MPQNNLKHWRSQILPIWKDSREIRGFFFHVKVHYRKTLAVFLTGSATLIKHVIRTNQEGIDNC